MLTRTIFYCSTLSVCWIQLTANAWITFSTSMNCFRFNGVRTADSIQCAWYDYGRNLSVVVDSKVKTWYHYWRTRNESFLFFLPNRLKMFSWCVREWGMRCQYITYSLALCALIFPYIYSGMTYARHNLNNNKKNLVNAYLICFLRPFSICTFYHFLITSNSWLPG